MALGDWLKGKTTELKDRVNNAQLGDALKGTTDKLTEQVKNAQLGDMVKGAANGLVSRAKSAMEDLAKERAAQRAEKERLDRLWAIIDTRFPPSRFPRMHQAMVKDHGDAPNIHEHLTLWTNILDEWPNEPENDIIRQEREEIYWRRELQKNLTRSSDGAFVFLPKQTILDDWWTYEKWNFRRYYAATGIVQPSVFSHQFVENWLTIQKFKHKKSWNTQNANERRDMQRDEEAKKFVKNFFDSIIPAHREKWGNWYLFHIDQAYKKGMNPPTRTFPKPSDEL